MAGEVRQRMIDHAVLLLARKGPLASFSEVLEASGAPRGSLYHHFPGGKDELVLAAMDAASQRAIAFLEPMRGEPADKVAEAFVNLWRAVLARSKFEAGCAVLAVTVTSDASTRRARAGQIFRAWRDLITGMLEAGGVPADRAKGLGAALISACEGAVAIARAEGSMEPFDLAAAEQVRAIRDAMAR